MSIKNIYTMKKKLFYSSVFILATIMLVSSCSKSYNSPMPMNTNSGSKASVAIKNMAFIPDTITVKAGTTVTWSNMDGMTHTVTSNTSLFNSGNLGSGLNFSYMFATAGTYGYSCIIHPTMKGVVIVN